MSKLRVVVALIIALVLRFLAFHLFTELYK
ncbi:photosystem I reaction center subunit XII [cyanobacterium endosymbiont of Rhopalodia gibberula]|nr:photosystem I reaction center subunit XII [cyanobacterium endosymbiont of Rhopalodia gibberula]